MSSGTFHIALCTHRLSGAGRAPLLAREVAARLSARGISFQLFEDHWPSAFPDFTDIWLVGGDGTLNYFVNHYPENRLPLGIFPGGTGNDFHWLLYGKCGTDEQLDRMLSAAPRPIDLGRCNHRHFLNNMGIGFEGAVARALHGKKKRPGKAGYLVAVLRQVFTHRSRHYRIRLEAEEINGRFMLINISNGRRAAGGFHIAPVAAADDGWLDLLLCKPLPFWKRLRYLPVMERGDHLDLPFIRHLRVKSLGVEGEMPAFCHFDGEFAEEGRLSIEILEGRLLFRF